MICFDEVSLRGDAVQRGQQHGELLAQRIHATLDFYRDIFAMPKAEVLTLAKAFAARIRRFSPAYADEIDAIADAAGLDRRWLYALNARTEILSRKPRGASHECTSVYFSQTALLGQNWDWGRALESLAVVMRIEREDGHRICMLTEPGIIGKIGFNSAGLGVCLNILTNDQLLNGLPVHVLLRAVLDAPDFAAALAQVRQHAGGKSSNLLIASAGGEAIDVEFNGDRVHELAVENGSLLHTNHYLGEPCNARENTDFFSSYHRYDTATRWLAQRPGREVTAMQDFLSDTSDRAFPIYRDYIEDAMVREVGTVCSVVMDLPARRMHLRRGKHDDSAFVTIGLQP